jgi:hypothetical protein
MSTRIDDSVGYCNWLIGSIVRPFENDPFDSFEELDDQVGDDAEWERGYRSEIWNHFFYFSPSLSLRGLAYTMTLLNLNSRRRKSVVYSIDEIHRAHGTRKAKLL